MANLLLPEEVWEVILGNLDDSGDVVNAFRAYPELEMDGALKRKRLFCLFDQVFAHVFTWLPQEVLLACRQVCREWTRTVDNHLANYQDKRAFDLDQAAQVRGRIWLPPARQSHWHLVKYFPGMKEFSSLEMCLQFLRDMDQHPPGRNPFLGRSVSMSDKGMWSHGAMGHFWNDGVLEILRKFGKHVWFLTLIITYRPDANRFPQLLLHFLSFVPNLKSLEIASSKSGRDISRFLVGNIESLPPLPHLGTLGLKFGLLMPSMVSLMVKGYSEKIRRLDLNIKFWEESYSKMFPNLTELHLVGVTLEVYLAQLLLIIESPQLHSLEVDFVLCFDESLSHVYVNDIFLLLKRFPQLQSAVFTSSSSFLLGRAMSRAGLPFCVPSLKSLVVWSCEGTHNWVDPLALQCFPALEYLKVEGVVELEKLWKLLPKLKEVTVRGYSGASSTSRRDS